MGRPSKLTDKQWSELIRLHASGDKTAAELARNYKVSPGQISRRVSQHSENVRNVAKQVADAEIAFERLPVTQQHSARSIADQMKGMQNSFMAGAAKGLDTAEILQNLANGKAKTLHPDTVETEDLRLVAALTDTANKAAVMGTSLLNANKGKEAASDEPQVPISRVVYRGS